MKTDDEVELRYDEANNLDEVVTNKKQHVHIERMSDGHIWMTVGAVVLNIYLNHGLLMMEEQS